MKKLSGKKTNRFDPRDSDNGLSSAEQKPVSESGKTHPDRGNKKTKAEPDLVTLSKQELHDLIKNAVAEAMKGEDYSSRISRSPGSMIGSLAGQALVKASSEIAKTADFFLQRWKGNYQVDDFGHDHELTDKIEPLFSFLFNHYWRIEVKGIENVPDKGRALLVANHSGTLPYDAMMISQAIQTKHSHPRQVRFLYLDYFSRLPVVNILMARLGMVVANPDNASDLLERDYLTGVFPEGVKGIGKLYSERYRLARFGRGGFVKTALQTKAPVIPVAVVGAEEIHPVMAKASILAKVLDVPYFPITPTFPLLGPLGFIPFPSKWIIQFGKPVSLSEFPPDKVHDENLVQKLSEQVRNSIQNMIVSILRTRRSAYFD